MAEKTEATTIDIGETSKEAKGKARLLPTPPPPPPAVDKAARGRYSKGFAIFDLILRLSAIASAIGATVTMGTAEEILPFFTQFFQFHATYNDITTFTFFVVAVGFVLGYLVVSLPFSIVCIVRPHAKGPRLFLVIADTLMLVLGTAAAGASASIVYLAHNGNSDANWLAICNQYADFCQATSAAVVAAFLTVLILIFLIVLSAFALRRI